MGQQFRVGHAGPEEVTEAVRQRVVGQRRDDVFANPRLRGRACSVHTVEDVRRDEDAGKGVANGLFMSEPALAQFAIERQHGVAFGRLHRAAIRTFGEGGELLDVVRLRCDARLRRPANRGAELVEVQLRHLARLGGRPAGGNLGFIQPPQLAELPVARKVLVLGAEVIELRREHEVRCPCARTRRSPRAGAPGRC